MRRPMRRWDLWAGLGALAIAALDLVAFGWAGLDVGRLAASAPGAMVLTSFVLGYGAVGFVSGRLYMARERSREDARRIAEQLDALEQSRAQLAQSEKLAALGRLAAGIASSRRVGSS